MFKGLSKATVKESLREGEFFNNCHLSSIFEENIIEILSHGGLGVEQDLEGFYSGVSIPVNEVLASIFLQLRLSERSGRGVPKIVGAYGRESIRIEKNFIVVTIPFNRINVTPFELNGDEESKIHEQNIENATVNATVNLSLTQKKILDALSENAYVTQTELAEKIGIH